MKKTEQQPWTWSEWYKKNKDRHNKDRRSRYASDPEYRAQVIQNNRLSRERQREELKTQRLAEQAAIKIRVVPRPWEVVVRKINGVETQLFSVGALAHASGRSVQSLSAWEQAGLIPGSDYKDDQRHRLYTAERIEEICEVLEDKGKLPTSRVRPGRPSRPFEVWIRKLGSKTPERVLVSTIQSLAQTMNRSAATVQQLEKRKAIPKTSLRKGGRRLYTQEMISSVRSAFEKRVMIRGSEWIRLHDEILEEWKRTGMDGAVVVRPPKDSEVTNAKDEKAARPQVA